MRKPKVTLGFKPYDGGFGRPIEGTYQVMQISGSKPTVAYKARGTPMVARVGGILTEAEATALGLVADLTVKPYKA